KCTGKKIAIIGTGNGSAEMALNLSIWSDAIVLCTHGRPADFDPEAAQKLKAARIPIFTAKIRRIQGDPEEGQISGFELQDGQFIHAAGAFANEGCLSPEQLLAQIPL